MTKVSDNLRGAGFMLIAMTAFTLNDACMKALANDLPLFQSIFLRSSLVVLFLGVLTWRPGHFRVSPRLKTDF